MMAQKGALKLNAQIQMKSIQLIGMTVSIYRKLHNVVVKDLKMTG